MVLEKNLLSLSSLCLCSAVEDISLILSWSYALRSALDGNLAAGRKEGVRRLYDGRARGGRTRGECTLTIRGDVSRLRLFNLWRFDWLDVRLKFL